MDLYIVENNSITAVEKETFALEKDIQALIESNLNVLFGLQFVVSEYTVGDFRLDTLAYDDQSGSFVIIEYKKGSSYSVIDQGYSYLSVMLNNKADFILEYNDRMDRNLKRTDVNWASSRVIFISPSFNSYQKNSVNFKDVPFELWEISKFDGGLFGLDQVLSSSTQSINDTQRIKATSTNQSESIISKVSAEVKQTSEDELISKLPENLRNVWDQFRERLTAFPDTYISTRGSNSGYISWMKGNLTISFLNITKNQIRADIRKGTKSKEGVPQKRFFTIDDPKGLSTESSWTWKDGSTGHTYQIPVKDTASLDYVIYLLNQKYEAAQ